MGRLPARGRVAYFSLAPQHSPRMRARAAEKPRTRADAPDVLRLRQLRAAAALTPAERMGIARELLALASDGAPSGADEDLATLVRMRACLCGCGSER